MRLAKALIVAETMLRECSTQKITLGEMRELGADSRMLWVLHLVLQATHPFQPAGPAERASGP